MTEVLEKSKCTGCNACVSVCPKQCISMATDNEGFWYPKINSKKCINCNLCVKTCPVISKEPTVQFQKTYAAFAKDDKIRLLSSSGGIFSLLAQWIIDNGGVVFGATFDDLLQVKHICVNNESNLQKLRMSKYSQSYIGDSFVLAKSFLESGKKVLFSGTPCQIAGLKKYLKKDYSDLYTVDIVCLGVPSPLLWNKNIKYLENKTDKLVSVRFRDKSTGWERYHISYSFSSGKVKASSTDEDLFFKAYLRKICLRPSCYNCSFKGENRASDITLADFWGIKQVLPNMDDDKGTNLVICNNEKGLYLLEKSKDKMVKKSTTYEKAIMCNPMAVTSANRPGSRDIFFTYLKKHGFSKATTLFCSDIDTMVQKVQDMEDYNSVKNEKGEFFATLWKIKTVIERGKT